MIEKSIGESIRRIRREKKIRLEDLAERTGITTGYLSKIERGLSNLPIATLGKIASALRVKMADIFEDQFSEEQLLITRPSERRTIRPLDRNLCYHYEPLASKMRDKLMAPFMVTLRTGCSEEKLFSHQGEEMMVLVKGQMILFYGTEQYTIDEIGTCIYFDASIPHRAEALGDEEAQFIAVISMRDFEDTEFEREG